MGKRGLSWTWAELEEYEEGKGYLLKLDHFRGKVHQFRMNEFVLFRLYEEIEKLGIPQRREHVKELLKQRDSEEA